MKELKEYNLCNRIVYLLTYADNNAIGYFEKQGFIDNFNLHKSVYQDYIQMYDESLLMACRIRNDGKVWAKPRPPPVDKPNDNLGENHSLVDKPNDNLREKQYIPKCERCQIELYSFQDQITHMEQEHDKKGGTAGPYAFKCQKCLGSFSSANLWKHKNGHKFENQDPKEAATLVDKPNNNPGENHPLVDKPNDNLREKPSEAVRPSQVQEVDSTEDHQQGEGQQNEQDEHKQDQHEQDQHEQQQHQEQQHVEVVAMPSSNKEQSNVQEKVDNSDSENDKQAAEDAEVEAGPVKQNFAIQWAITCVDCNKLPCSCEMILPG